ncbi:MAG: AAA family ATPase [Verrucomicrobia bacterium]|nr:AAA family ATPase [Verrucomicrobiota bacterium]MCH8510956.1 AAA family ATPase [Kiritimatiellia bacterium]
MEPARNEKKSEHTFHECLLACACRFAANDGESLLDLTALWKGFLYLAHHESDRARNALHERWPERDWHGAVPNTVSDGTSGTPKHAPEIIRLLGPLGVLNKKYGGQFTEENFFAALDSVNAWPQLGIPHPSQADKRDVLPLPGDGDDAGVCDESAPEPSEESLPKPAAQMASLQNPALAEALADLRTRLEMQVFGQTAAMRAFADSLCAALDRPVQPGRLGGSFLVLGPNGCGKGEMVRVLEDWTKAHKASLRTKRVVRCEGFLQHSLHTLHHEISGGDPGFLVFSEFEKYQSDFRDILLEGLDRAVLQLPKVGGKERLDFTPIHGWIIILIGNVGRALWGRLPFKEQHLLPDREHIREVLEQESISDSHHKSSIFEHSLSRSFLDRLDFFIPFCQLRYADVERILMREITTLTRVVESRGGQLAVSPRVVELIVLGSYYKKAWSARQCLRGFKQHIENPVYDVLTQGGRQIRLTCVDKRFNRTLQRSRPRLLLLDDEAEQVLPLMREGLQDVADIVGAGDISEALERASESPPELLVLDMFFGEENRPLWKEYLQTWRTAHPDVPVLLLSGKKVTCSDRLEIDKTGGVLGFVSKTFRPEEMRVALLPFLDHAGWQARVRAFEREYGYGGDRIVFDVSTNVEGSDAELSFSGVNLVVANRQADRGSEPILPEKTRQAIDEFVALFLDSRKRAALRIKQPRGILLHGPPGNGKTMVARSLARRMRCNFMALAASDFQGRWAGMRSERIKEVFEQARMRQPCVVFIDEIDGVAPRRQEDSGGGMLRDQADAVAALLTQLDGFDDGSEVFLIGATNRKEALDDALLRPGRIDRMIEVGKPGLRERVLLLEQLLGEMPKCEIPCEWAARECFGLSCAEITKVVGEAKLLALGRMQGATSVGAGMAPETADFREAVDHLRFGDGETRSPSENRALQREVTAWHEAGHLVVSMALMGRVPERVTITPRGDFGGYVRFAEEDARSSRRRRSDCIHELAVMLAGGASEVMKFGEHGSGVSRDREQAYALAHAMVAHWGMGSPEAEAEGFLRGRGRTQGQGTEGLPSGAASNQHLVASMAAIVNEASERTDQAVQEFRRDIERAATLLIEKEELTRDDLVAAFPNWAQNPAIDEEVAP